LRAVGISLEVLYGSVVDPDSTYHPDADPDSDFYLMRIRIRIQLITLMRIRIHNTALWRSLEEILAFLSRSFFNSTFFVIEKPGSGFGWSEKSGFEVSK
jgi:hypothetical protein